MASQPTKTRRWLAWFVIPVLSFGAVALLLSCPLSYPGNQIEIGRDAKLRADFQAFGQSLQAYDNLNGLLPTTEQGLGALVARPATEPEPKHWYQMLKRIPKDPYGSDYVYLCPGKHNPAGFDLYSKGIDRLADTSDDKRSWDPKYAP